MPPFSLNAEPAGALAWPGSIGAVLDRQVWLGWPGTPVGGQAAVHAGWHYQAQALWRKGNGPTAGRRARGSVASPLSPIIIAPVDVILFFSKSSEWALDLSLLVGGYLAAALLAAAVGSGSSRWRGLWLAGFTIATGLVLDLIMTYWLEGLPSASFWIVWPILALIILVTALFAAVLRRALGPVVILVTVMLVLQFGNPSSGGSNGVPYLPSDTERSRHGGHVSLAFYCRGAILWDDSMPAAGMVRPPGASDAGLGPPSAPSPSRWPARPPTTAARVFGPVSLFISTSHQPSTKLAAITNTRPKQRPVLDTAHEISCLCLAGCVWFTAAEVGTGCARERWW